MKRVLSTVAVLLLLTGCVSNSETRQTEASQHDHFAPQVRQEELFYFEEEQMSECTMYYLAYKEPDGCITRVYSFMNDKPKMYACESAFYFIFNDSDTLERVSFTGEYSSLRLEGGESIEYIVRTSEDGIYCAVDQGSSFICVALDLGTWEEVSSEQALNA